MVSQAEDSEPGGIDGVLQIIAEPKGLRKRGHKLGSETGSRITSKKGLGTSALWLVAVVRALATCKSLKGNVSTMSSRYLAKLNNSDVTTSLEKGDLRLGRRRGSYISDEDTSIYYEGGKPRFKAMS